MIVPTFDTYCARTTNENALVFSFGAVDVFFSYRTPVAFRAPSVNGGRAVVRRNEWGPTTGKHLNAIDGGDKDARIDGAEFERMLREVCPTTYTPDAD